MKRITLTLDLDDDQLELLSNIDRKHPESALSNIVIQTLTTLVKDRVTSSRKSRIAVLEKPKPEYVPKDQTCPHCGSHVSKDEFRKWEGVTAKGRGYSNRQYYCSNCQNYFAPTESKYKNLTKEELLTIKRLYCIGISGAAIARDIGRTRHCVNDRIKKMRERGEIPAIATITQLKERIHDDITYLEIINQAESLTDKQFQDWIKQFDRDRTPWSFNPLYQPNQFTANEDDLLDEETKVMRQMHLDRMKFNEPIDEDAVKVQAEIDSGLFPGHVKNKTRVLNRLED